MMQFFVFFCFSIFFIKTATKQKNILNKQKYNLLQCFNNCDKLRQTATATATAATATATEKNDLKF